MLAILTSIRESAHYCSVAAYVFSNVHCVAYLYSTCGYVQICISMGRQCYLVKVFLSNILPSPHSWYAIEQRNWKYGQQSKLWKGLWMLNIPIFLFWLKNLFFIFGILYSTFTSQILRFTFSPFSSFKMPSFLFQYLLFTHSTHFFVHYIVFFFLLLFLFTFYFLSLSLLLSIFSFRLYLLDIDQKIFLTYHISCMGGITGYAPVS